MTDPLAILQKRLGWIQRGLVVAVALALVAVFIVVLRDLQSSPKRPPPAASAASKAHLAPTSSLPAQAAVLPRPVASAAHPAASAAPAVAPTFASRASAPGPHPAGSAAAMAPVAPASAASAAPTAASSAPPAAAARVPGLSPQRHVAPVAQEAARPAAPSRAVQRHPRTAAHRTAATASACRRHGWYLQVGAFARTASVEHLRARLRRAGHASCVAPQHPKHLELLYVGPYRSAAAARAEQPRLRKLLNSNNYLRRIPAR